MLQRLHGVLVSHERNGCLPGSWHWYHCIPIQHRCSFGPRCRASYAQRKQPITDESTRLCALSRARGVLSEQPVAAAPATTPNEALARDRASMEATLAAARAFQSEQPHNSAAPTPMSVDVADDAEGDVAYSVRLQYLTTGTSEIAVTRTGERLHIQVVAPIAIAERYEVVGFDEQAHVVWVDNVTAETDEAGELQLFSTSVPAPDLAVRTVRMRAVATP